MPILPATTGQNELETEKMRRFAKDLPLALVLPDRLSTGEWEQPPVDVNSA